MSCHELSALRLGLMQVLGVEDAAERQHEMGELGDAVNAPGPLQSLCGAQDLGSMKTWFEAAVTDLESRVARTSVEDPKLPYLRSLVVLTKKVELDLANQVDSLTRLYRDLEEMHDFVHEIYPGG